MIIGFVGAEVVVKVGLGYTWVALGFGTGSGAPGSTGAKGAAK